MNVMRVASRVARAGVLAVVVMVMATSGVLAAWNPSIVVRPASFQAWGPDLAASGTNVVVAWGQGPFSLPVTVWVARSTNSGTSFGTPVRLFKNSANAAQDITVFTGPTAHFAVWSEVVAGGGSRVFMSRATFGGGWSPAVQVSSNTSATQARRPRIVSSGNILILTYQTSNTSYGPFSAYTRVKIGSGPWGSATLLPGGVQEGTVSVAVSASRVLVVWSNNAGQVRQRQGAITNSGTSFAWFTIYLSLGTGRNPIIVLAGTHAVVLWEDDADIYRRLSANSGTSWGPQSKILNGNPGSDVSAGDPFNLYDAAMNNANVAFTTATGDSPELGGDGFRMTSGNFGSSWTKTLVSLEAGDQRQVAYTQVGGIPKLAEAWLRVQGQTYPFELRYHRET